MTCHACGANGAYSIVMTKCVRCGADYRNRPKDRPESPCPNCGEPFPPLNDECWHCSFNGRCRNCDEPTDFSPDPLYCTDLCRVQGEIERYEVDRV